MNDPHVASDLSAYLDAELAPADRARVSTHLARCARCARQLAELRATATLIAALPSPRPSRSLVPSLAPRWNWLRPVRSLSAVASGAFLMVFLVSAVAQSGSDLGGGPASPFGQGAAPAAVTAAAQPAAAEQMTGETAPSADVRVGPAEPAPAAVAPGRTPTPEEERAADAAQTGAPEAFSAPTAAQADNEAEARLRGTSGQGPEPLSPLIWLALSFFAGVVALVAHRRVRTI